MEENKINELYLKSRGFRKTFGYAINTQEMNPEEYDEIFFEGNNLFIAIKDFVRCVGYWIYEPSSGEQIFEDIDEAIEYIDDGDYEIFIKAHTNDTNKNNSTEAKK